MPTQPPTKPSKLLETFDNPNPERDYRVQITIPEFTCLCPKTGQPDFATLYLDYIADRKCVELKSLKQYVWSYRNEGAFHEAVTNIILNDLVAATHPRYMQLRAEFNVRGGIYTSVTVEHRQDGWREQAPPPIEQPAASPVVTPSKAPAPTLARPALKPEPVESKAPEEKPAPVETKKSGTGARFRMLPRARETETPEPIAPTSVTPPRAEPKTPPAKAAPKPAAKPPIYIGIDLGSSGCTAVAIDAQGRVLQQVRTPMPLPTKREDQVTQDPQVWWQAVMQCLRGVSKGIEGSRVAAISVDGTSGTILLADNKGAPVTPALMYNDSRAHKEAARIAEIADRNSGAHGNTSALAKLLWLDARASEKKTRYCLHQSDWILGKLSGVFGVSDYNNTLKLGYDAERSKWPDWFAGLSINASWLPRVVAPGTPLGNIRRELAQELGFSAEARVLAGTTDGVASFLAAGASEPGQAVTSLGSTLVLKLLSDRAVYSPEHGVYSHRLGNRWLVGGASNAGGAALLQYFKLEQIEEMTPLLEPDTPTGLEYYPLSGTGERFPIYDPEMAPVLEPLPGDSVTFFQGMLEGIARIEAQGYKLLTKLGAPNLKQVFTTGGGSENPAWQRIRERVLGVAMTPPRSRIAAYGTALLAAGATGIDTEAAEKITVA